MAADWELDEEMDRIEEENRSIDAEIAAKLVILGYGRDAAVNKVKDVNENREYYRNDPGVHIGGDEDQPSEWTISECNFPKEISGEFDSRRVYQIAQDLIDKF